MAHWDLTAYTSQETNCWSWLTTSSAVYIWFMVRLLNEWWGAFTHLYLYIIKFKVWSAHPFLNSYFLFYIFIYSILISFVASDIVLVDDSAITISEDRTPQNHKPTSSYSSPFSNHVSHNLPSHHHHQVRMLKQLNSPIPVMQSLHTPQHQSAHPQCLALVAHKVPVTQHSLAGEQQAMKGPHHGQLQVDQQDDHARTVPHKVDGSQRLAMEPLQRPLRDHQQQQLMNSQPVPSSNQQRHNIQVKLSTCQSHSPLPENCNSGGQGTKYCLQQQQQHGLRKDQFHLQHRNRESQQQLQHHAQLSTVSTEQQNASVQRCDSFIIKPDVCGSTDSRTHCVPQSLVSKEAYPQTVRINSTPQHINAGRKLYAASVVHNIHRTTFDWLFFFGAGLVFLLFDMFVCCCKMSSEIICSYPCS